MTIANDEKNLIMNVILSCNELIDGKFILADSKISKILKDVTESKEVYNLLSECMANFNFEREFIRAKIKLPTKPGYFKKLPVYDAIKQEEAKQAENKD